MADFLQNFIEFLHKNGIPPVDENEIIADDTKRRYRVEGDKPKTLNGTYQVKFDGDFAVGWAMSYKEGEVYKYTGRSSKTYTPEEKAAFKEKLAKERAIKDKQRKAEAEKIAAKAAKIWKAASKEGEIEYLERKQCGTNGARFYKDMLAVPAYRDGKIATMQMISADGSKKFLTGGDLVGGYFPIATAKDDKSVLLLCEGFSTGDSIRKATGLPVICCFNAGNLLPVAQAMRKKYPDSLLIICADNDEYTQIRGEYKNVGLEKAKQAAIKAGGARVIFPEFENNSEELKLSDFNDAYIAQGADYVKNRIGAALKNAAPAESGRGESPVDDTGFVEQQAKGEESAPVQSSANMPISSIGEDWMQTLFCDDKGVMVKNHLGNATIFLFNDPILKGAFVYDEFHMEVMVYRDVTGTNKDFKIHPLADADITQVALYFESRGLLKDERKIASLINYVAGYNRINPAKDYFNSLKWDGVDRLSYWLIEAFDAPEPEEYLAAIGRKWLTAGVKRVFEPACKFDHMLMLEGSQGAGKSSALELLAAFGEKVDDPLKHQPEKTYFTDALTFDAMGDKDCMLLTAGSIIVVLEELVGKGKRSDEDIKRWLTLRSDKGRLPYARAVTEMKRQFILAGTTNTTDYLRDPTGNRRFWCLTVQKVDKHYINNHREQLWAEAVHCYKEGLYLGLVDREIELAELEQKKRLEEDVWESAVKSALIDLQMLPFTIEEVMGKMNLTLKDQDARSAARIRNILKAMGYANKPVWQDGKTRRLWTKEND